MIYKTLHRKLKIEQHEQHWTHAPRNADGTQSHSHATRDGVCIEQFDVLLNKHL